KRSKINQKFNGYLYYEKYKVTFTIDRIETADVIIPYLGNGCKHRRQITEEVNCIVYRIKEIKSIEPIE
ncbi:MAG: hypothetical protein RL757_1184, partial [Bacteroidota bacterium]